MKNSQLQKILRLVRATGDTAIVLDPATDDLVVLMPLEKYESLRLQNQSPSEAGEADEDDEGPGQPIYPEEEAPELPLPEEEEQSPPPASARIRQLVEPMAAGVSAAAGGKLNFSPDWAEHNARTTEELTNLPEEPEEQFYLEPVE